MQVEITHTNRKSCQVARSKLAGHDRVGKLHTDDGQIVGQQWPAEPRNDAAIGEQTMANETHDRCVLIATPQACGML